MSLVKLLYESDVQTETHTPKTLHTETHMIYTYIYIYIDLLANTKRKNKVNHMCSKH